MTSAARVLQVHAWHLQTHRLLRADGHTSLPTPCLCIPADHFFTTSRSIVFLCVQMMSMDPTTVASADLNEEGAWVALGLETAVVQVRKHPAVSDECEADAEGAVGGTSPRGVVKTRSWG